MQVARIRREPTCGWPGDRPGSRPLQSGRDFRAIGTLPAFALFKGHLIVLAGPLVSIKRRMFPGGL